jgi:hypothetical protein
MAPLGALPPQAALKIKFKVNQEQVPAEKGELREPLLPAIEMESKTPDSKTPEGSPRPAEPAYKVEASKTAFPTLDSVAPQLQTSSAAQEDERTPNGMGGTPRAVKSPTKMSTPKQAHSRRTSTSRSTPHSINRQAAHTIRTPSQSTLMPVDAVVEAAVERSRSLGQPFLGLALKRLYQESQHDPTLSVVLTAILHQKASPEQHEQFALQIKKVKKQLKVEEASARRLQKALGTSPHGSSKSTIGPRHSAPSTIESPGSRTPPHPPPPLSFYPFPASVSTFRPAQPFLSQLHQRSTTPPFPPSQPLSYFPNGAGAIDDKMVSTRSGRDTDAAPVPAPASNNAPIATNSIPAPVTLSQPTVSSATIASAGPRTPGSRKASVGARASRTTPPAESGSILQPTVTESDAPVTNGRSPDPVAPASPPIASIEVADDAPAPTPEPVQTRKTRNAKNSKPNAVAPSSKLTSTTEQPVQSSPRRSRRKSTAPLKATRRMSETPSEHIVVPVTSEDEREQVTLIADDGSPISTTVGAVIRGDHRRRRSTQLEDTQATDSENIDVTAGPTPAGTSPLGSTPPPVDTPILADDAPTASDEALQRTRAGSAASLSSLSDIDEVLIDEGPPSQPDSPPRAMRGRGKNTRLTLTNKSKPKKHPSSSGIGFKASRANGKRPATEAPEPSEEVVRKRQRVLEDLQAENTRNKAGFQAAYTRAVSTDRFAPEYEHIRSESRDPSVTPKLPAQVSSIRTTLAAVAPSRRTRGESSRQPQIDALSANAPDFSAGPSTPRSELGEPAKKKRKGARTKTS